MNQERTEIILILLIGTGLSGNVGYREFEDVSEIMNVCYALNEKDEDGYAYKVIEIGEDNATEEYANEAGYEVFDDFYVVVDVNLPSDIREIE